MVFSAPVKAPVQAPFPSAGAAAAPVDIYCTFNDPNGTSLNAYSWTDPADKRPGVAQWVEQASDWDIQTAKARLAVSALPGIATLNCSAADGTITTTLTIAGGGSTMFRGLIYRYLNNNNFWIAGIRTGEWAIVEVSGGVWSVRATLPFALGGGTWVIRVVLAGNNMIATRDGANQLNFASGTGAANTIHGIATRYLGETFENFSMTG